MAQVQLAAFVFLLHLLLFDGRVVCGSVCSLLVVCVICKLGLASCHSAQFRAKSMNHQQSKRFYMQ